MKSFVAFISAALLSVFLVASTANAATDQATAVKNETLGAEEDAVNAKALAQTCVSCHGVNGVSPSPAWPNLAGQKSAYLAAQIKAYRDEIRVEPTMAPFVKNLSDREADALAEYYSNLPHPGNPQADNLNKAGENVRSQCIACHGMYGYTVNSEWPNLAGQKQLYLEQQLLAYRDGSRHAPEMNVITNGLSDQQIKDVAEYYSQLAY